MPAFFRLSAPAPERRAPRRRRKTFFSKNNDASDAGRGHFSTAWLRFRPALRLFKRKISFVRPKRHAEKNTQSFSRLSSSRLHKGNRSHAFRFIRRAKAPYHVESLHAPKNFPLRLKRRFFPALDIETESDSLQHSSPLTFRRITIRNIFMCRRRKRWDIPSTSICCTGLSWESSFCSLCP